VVRGPLLAAGSACAAAKKKGAGAARRERVHCAGKGDCYPSFRPHFFLGELVLVLSFPVSKFFFRKAHWARIYLIFCRDQAVAVKAVFSLNL